MSSTACSSRRALSSRTRRASSIITRSDIWLDALSISRNSAAPTMQMVVLVSAVTLADLGSPSIAASSPKNSPSRRSARMNSRPPMVRN